MQWFANRGGYSFGDFAYSLWMTKERGVTKPKAMVTGVQLHALRGWYSHFRRFSWSNSAGQTIYITLFNPAIDDELMNDAGRAGFVSSQMSNFVGEPQEGTSG